MKPRLLITFLIIILIGATVVLGATFLWSGHDQVIAGVKVQGVDLQGLNRNNGIEMIEELEKMILDKPVILTYQEKIWELPLKEVETHLDAGAMMDAALRLGREGSFFQQWHQRHQIKQQGHELPYIIY